MSFLFESFEKFLNKKNVFVTFQSRKRNCEKIIVYLDIRSD